MENVAFISLGSNMGNRLEYLKQAIKRLSHCSEVQIEKLSSIYETEPIGFTDQDQFLNMVIKISTSLSPHQLLTLCLDVEREIGRIREFKWGPRVIDLDILLYNKENIMMEDLQIPHPRMNERAFVLIPLMEIDSMLFLPSSNAPLVEILDEIPDKEGVRLWKQINGEDAFAPFEN
ncbi:2-amino-4-hydroxy-6-hydroxymethyldihydropteridine diphosphokinase [Lederbergia galactosidilytica]|uniref:2-amino-4-hydroxy-6-hydroxymethyldihydropteridine diphosphokinase n=1 Tax=Lederbergia galactosidilytica TaxID=217031 RepID=A0A0Q9XYA1_9BACI|nr:2-amino-4-hydroxy-6-hydroxymethyldihydropteridine diphosphokinase [Lederbergia galactosidilytica]KRG12866.1 2-amino-4-hydroxy-6-hydroxymethyldihydropteridine pyrophosphokinase [Virgibacillus soli]KRG13589.1 2-amino-4-hydroxy-6-hydroxymethyldihydropteridine pyrophosphokinase [Lederbergia galactosidilytica]MBP1916831.1 2-amino-4-hydroxy-6-hydroxymethyldihydropteridine diphosphokinase [Lederbergia galactosidilytica]OAK72077.1 2-amino-4-hydroxy-6-hydroxymethyldihydropteridine pyrophosphokinase [